MSLTSALSIALSGIQVSSAATNVISGNISNAQTPGYTEKGVNLSEVINSTNLGGVEVSSYSRVSDSVLSATLNNATSNASYLSTQNSYMTQIQQILDSSDDPPAFSAAVSNFESAWTEFSASPEDVTQQKNVVAAGQQLASTISTISSQAQALQTQVQTDLGTSVQSLNNDLAQVQSLNTQIETAVSNNQPPGDLEDQRDTLINQISTFTNVQVLQRSNGQIALYTPGGTPLLDGQAQVFSVSGNTVVNAVGADVGNILTGGKLQAQVDFLSDSNSTSNGVGVINKLESQLQNFTNMFVSPAAGGFADTYDSAASSGSTEQGSDFFTATIDADTGLPDLSSFQVNPDLVSGTTTVKEAAATPVANSFTATGMAIDTSTDPATTSTTFTADGLTTNNQTFSQIANSILSGFQQQANTISNSSATATTQQTYYQNALSSETGVNTDTELVNLTNWQNAYAASAHVIATIQQMFTTLEAAMSGT